MAGHTSCMLLPKDLCVAAGLEKPSKSLETFQKLEAVSVGLMQGERASAPCEC